MPSVYNTIQYKNDFNSAGDRGCRGARGQAINGPVFNSSQTDESSDVFVKYCQTSSVDDIIRESVPHGRRRDGESATADDRSCPRDDQPLRTA